MTKTNTPEI